MCDSFPFGFAGLIWDLTVPGHCLSFYFGNLWRCNTSFYPSMARIRYKVSVMASNQTTVTHVQFAVEKFGGFYNYTFWWIFSSPELKANR